MKPLPLLVVCSTVAAFMYLAVYGYHHQHDAEHGYTKVSQDNLVRLLNAPKPAIVELFADDGQPVNQRIKLREWHAARRTMGKE